MSTLSTFAKSRRLRFSDEDRKSRLEKLREATGLGLPTYATSLIDPRSLSGNIENFIGTLSIPIGIAGPLKINFSGDQYSEVYAPIATTEGALVSSIHRGALAISLSGGVNARVISSKMSRAPQFEFESIDAAIFFTKWIGEQKPQLEKLVKNRSQFAELTEVKANCFGRTVHVRFVYKTGNAAGQNMTTFCTSYLCQWLLRQFETDTDYTCLDFIIEGNLSSDKKVSHLSAYEGRGHSVTVETTIKKSVLRRVFKLNAEELVSRFSRSKSARMFTGQIGFNINVANVVAGLFIATGQDAACIHESSIGELHLEQRGEDLYASLLLPCLVVGTVGGGTHLPNYRDNLAILGCLEGENSADRLAQIIASYCLALELSTVSAVAGGQFVSAHENNARKSTFNFLKSSDLNEEFFKKSLADQQILKVQEIKTENKQGYLTDIALQVSKRKTGIYAYQIESRNDENSLVRKNAFLKLKAHDREIVLGSAKIIQVINPSLVEVLLRRSEYLPFKDSHLREIEVLENEKRIIQKISPRFLGSFIDKEKETYILIQELIDSQFAISEINQVDVWTHPIKQKCLENLSLLHLEYLNKKDQAFAISSYLIDYTNANNIEEQVELWDSLFALAYSKTRNNYPYLFQTCEDALQNFEKLIADLSSFSHTLIHYDFNPRNIAFNKESQQVLFFDYEFAAWGVPQRDFIEFLIFTSHPAEIINDLNHWAKIYYELMSESNLSFEQWLLGVEYSAREFMVRRLPFYFILSEFNFCPYIDRLLENLNLLSKHWMKKTE
jgi:NADP-dependent 3-hydroxy-3-methylglutaryl-CoA reductase